MASGPLLVAIEGVDGAGLTTTSRLLVSMLRGVGVKAVYTKEPSRSIIGDLTYYASKGIIGFMNTPYMMLMLFAADRMAHLYHLPHEPEPGVVVEGGVLGLLRRGYVVVSDRYVYSSYVYQTIGVKAPSIEDVKRVNWFTYPPHILVYLRVPIEIAARRRLTRHGWGFDVYRDAKAYSEASRRYEELVKSLARSPEYCPGEKPSWLKPGLVEEGDLWIWPKGVCYPVPVVVEEVYEGRELKPEEVTAHTMKTILCLGAIIGLLEEKFKEYCTEARELASRGLIKVLTGLLK